MQFTIEKLHLLSESSLKWIWKESEELKKHEERRKMWEMPNAVFAIWEYSTILDIGTQWER